MLEHLGHRIPVTALAFCGSDVIFAGEGHFLCAYKTTTNRLLGRVQAFESQSIHGILVSEDVVPTVLVWGGNLYRTADYASSGQSLLNFQLHPVHTAPDWIFDAARSPNPPESDLRQSLLGFVTAHNELGLVRVAELDNARAPTKVQPAAEGSNCILYCAHIAWRNTSNCLVAAGTAFGGVVVWSATVDQCDDLLSVSTELHYTFSAHEGSLFGVQVSPRVERRTAKVAGVAGGYLLATCSDDRIIKVWDLSFLESGTPQSTSPKVPHALLDTGLGLKTDDNDSAPPCLAKAMAHSSRIWHVRFRFEEICKQDGELSAVIKLLSFGEDTTAKTWILKPILQASTDALPCVLVQSHIQTAHTGKHIWSVADAADGRVATGGADGAIALRHAARNQFRTGELSRSLIGADAARDNFRAYTFLNPYEILATTELGRVLVLKVPLWGGDTCVEREIIAPAASLRGYTIVTSAAEDASTSSRSAFIGSIDGTVYAYTPMHTKVRPIICVRRKIAALFACVTSNPYEDDEVSIGLLITSVGSGVAQLLRLIPEVWDDQHHLPTRCVELGLPVGFVVTAFTTLMLGSSTIVVLGSRDGSIVLYNDTEWEETPFSHSDPLLLYEHSTTPGPHTLSHVTLQHQAHGKEAVTALRCTLSIGDDNTANRYTTYLHSTGRDGTHAVHRITQTGPDITITLVHQLSLPFGPNIEGLELPSDHGSNGKLRIHGFRGKHFIVYDAVAHREIMSVECGGAHRSFALDTGAQPTLVWTKVSKLYYATQPGNAYTLANAGGHGREIKVVAVSSAPPHIIATGAEDTNIKLSTFSLNTGFKCLQTLRKHNTGIQHLQWSASGDYLFSSGGFEEFIVWRVTSGIPDIHTGVVCESAHPRCGVSDLRIMGFTASDVQTPGSDGPTKNAVNVTMVYSDSTLKLWTYEDKSWQLDGTADYLTACLMSVTESSLGWLATATDGHLVPFQEIEAMKTSNEPQRWGWKARHKVHANAILSTTSCSLSDKSTLIFTGGDDNAIGISRCDLTGRWDTLLVPRAHAAAVTGLAAVNGTGNDEYWIVSASIDQRVVLWRIHIDVTMAGIQGMEVKKCGSFFTAVADVSCADLLPLHGGETAVLVCGVGMDMWKLKLGERTR